MSYSITMIVSDTEYRRLARVAKHLYYIDDKGKGNIQELLTTITNRLVNARCSRDGHTYFADKEHIPKPRKYRDK
ncbi:TPA: hypothetical protein NQG77_000232 [Salmonella enterica subsp. enterica serovar Infantis]|nr:hypothetical protein [Salmonella enterica subsp. enterica serovar Infantis]